MSENGSRSWTEVFRIFTPILVTIAIFQLGNIMATMNKVDEKLFKHLTNEEIHCPRTVMTTRAEFDLMTKVQDKQIQDIKEVVSDELKQLRIEIRNMPLYREKWSGNGK